MGGFCSKRSVVDKSPSESTLPANGYPNSDSLSFQPRLPLPPKKQEIVYAPNANDSLEKKFREQSLSLSEEIARDRGDVVEDAGGPQLSRVLSQRSSASSKLSAPPKTGTAKVGPRFPATIQIFFKGNYPFMIIELVDVY